jgi:ankyrin repeat protein
MEGGTFRIPHSDEERRRESAVAALGGRVAGCFAVVAGWLFGTDRLPRRLREQRRDLMQRALHGDVDGVTALLDAGIDPHVRDHRRRTLLHLMPHLHDPGLLARLLAAGLDVNARDIDGLTPLFAAVHGMGGAELIRALVAAGASTDVADEDGVPAATWVARVAKPDLDVLGPLFGIAPQ